MMSKSTSRFLFPLLLLLLVNCSNPTQVSEPETSAAVETVADPLTWPSIVDDNWLTIHSLTELVYPESQDPATAWGTLVSSDKPKAILETLEKKLQEAVAAGEITQEEADEKFQRFKNYEWGKDDTVETKPEKSVPDWKRGYAYVFKVPMGYRKSTRDYPMVLYLHGGQSTYPGQYNVFLDQFYMSSGDPYILVAPSKIEWDWDANKIEEVIEDVKANLRVNDDRIYMTGVSMGGRGTYIVAAALPDLFSALMPLSSHHGPYSYVKLAPLVAHLPIWTSHGDRDSISSYDVATQMVRELERLGANVSFHTVAGGDHEGWDTIYRNSKTFDWLLSQQKVPSTTTPTPRPTTVPTSTPIKNSGSCVLTEGEVVKDGWSGKDTGSNSCNQCRCMQGSLACTKMACAPTMKPIPTTGRLTPTALSTSTPPYKGTLLIHNSSEIINESDPTLFDTLTKISDNPRKMFDRRNGWITITPFLFEATFTDGQSIEVQVNPEFESVQIAREIALIYLGPIGKLPTVLRQDVETIWLHKGKEPFGGGNNNLLIHHEKGLEYIRGGILEEAFLHEASHTSLDPYHYNNNWEAAQKADGNFISTYARDHPTREDLAESFPMYYALRYKPSRISYSLRDTIIDTIPNRVMYFDENLPSLEPTLPSAG